MGSQQDGTLDDTFGFTDVFKNDIFKQPNKKENFIEDHKETAPLVFFGQKNRGKSNGKRRGTTLRPTSKQQESDEKLNPVKNDKSNNLIGRRENPNKVTKEKAHKRPTITKDIGHFFKGTIAPKRRKPITSIGSLQFETSTEELQERIKKLKEEVRK